MTQRRVDGFFYGLFMDAGVLADSQVVPDDPRPGYVDGFALRIGRRATLVPDPGGRAYGMIYALTHGELARLYRGPGLEDYRPEAVMAQGMAGGTWPTLCYNLPEAPGPGESNAAYAEKLREALNRLEFPSDYIAGVG